MEAILTEIDSGSEESLQTALSEYNLKNKTNFNLGGTVETRKRFCSSLLLNLSGAPPHWQPKTLTLALTALRIFARGREGAEGLTCRAGIAPLLRLARLHCDVRGEEEEEEEGRVEVMVEAVKCLCNVILNHQYLSSDFAELGTLAALSTRLLLASRQPLLYDVVYFDLRLLFLITACGERERCQFRNGHNGLPVLISLLDATLFGSHGNITVETTGGNDTPINQPEEKSLQSADEDEAIKKDQIDEKDETIDDRAENDVKSKPSKESSSGGLKPHPQGAGPILGALPPVRSDVHCLPATLDDQKLLLLSEILKVLFNQTLNWREDGDCDEEELQLFVHLAHLIRLLLLSLPPPPPPPPSHQQQQQQRSKAAADTFKHAVEVLVNTTQQSASCFILPPHVRVNPDPTTFDPTPTLATTSDPSPTLATTSGLAATSGGASEGGGGALDVVFDGWNMAAIKALLNFLEFKLRHEPRSHDISTVLTALRTLSKGHRCIRRYLKSEVLPPLGEVKTRPEEGDSLKSRLVRMMTAGSGGGAEDATAEFLFVLCKENPNRLVKHTGFGNAAGLLMAHGLLGGGVSQEAGDYSSDSGESDTDEYQQSSASLDPVTAGPSHLPEASPLDGMTDEEKEEEAEKLHVLLDKLNRHGIIKMLPLDQHNQPLFQEQPKEEDPASSEEEENNDLD